MHAYDSWLDGWMPSTSPDEPDLPLRAKMRIGPDSVILPYERAGTLMVFRTFERLSFALVMSAKRPMFVLDAVRPPPA